MSFAADFAAHQVGSGRLGPSYIQKYGTTNRADARHCRHVARLLGEVAWLIEHDHMPMALAMYMTGLLKYLTL